jgi:hypothetical protein
MHDRVGPYLPLSGLLIAVEHNVRSELPSGIAWTRRIAGLMPCSILAASRSHQTRPGSGGGKRWPGSKVVPRVSEHLAEHISADQERACIPSVGVLTS